MLVVEVPLMIVPMRKQAFAPITWSRKPHESGVSCALQPLVNGIPKWVKSNGEIRAFDNINAAHLYADLHSKHGRVLIIRWKSCRKRSLPTASTPRQSTGY